MSTDFRSKINKTPEVEAAFKHLLPLKDGQLFTHIKSGRQYAYRGLATVKIHGEWFDIVLYDNPDQSIPRHTFTRLILDFTKSFGIIKGQHSYN